MGLGQQLEEALAIGRVGVEAEGQRAEVHVVEVDRIGVCVDHLRVSGPSTGVVEVAAQIPEAMRVLPERLVPVEVSPVLGGAVFRSDPKDMENQAFYEARSDGQSVELERYQVLPEGRQRQPFTLTHEQLRRLVDTLGKVF